MGVWGAGNHWRGTWASQVPAFYAARDRAAVLEQADRAEETYLLPPCALATRLLATAKSASASAAAAGPIPAEVPPGTMLLAVVHRKVGTALSERFWLLMRPCTV